MEEKIVIECDRASAKKVFTAALAIFGVIALIVCLAFNVFTYPYRFTRYLLLPLILAFFVILGIVALICNKKIVVTNKRVYCESLGIFTSLPFDSITSVGAGWFKSVSIATPSKRIFLMLISNSKEIYQTIEQMLVERQK